MSGPFRRTWQELLSKLSELLGPTATERSPAPPAHARTLHQVQTLLDILEGLPKPRAAAWAAVLVDMQVPQQLATLWCNSVVSKEPLQYLSGPVPLTFLTAVSYMLRLAFWGGADPTVTSSEADSMPPLQQQVMKSGLLQALTTLMEATAEQLQRWDATAAGADAAAAGSSSRGSRNNGRSQGHKAEALLSAAQRVGLQAVAAQLACIYFQMMLVLSRGPYDAYLSNPAAVSYTAATMHLTLAAARHITACLAQQHQQQQQQGNSNPLDQSLSLLAAYSGATMGPLLAFSKEHTSVVLTKSPKYQAWAVLAAVVAVYASVLRQQQCLPEVQGLGSAHSSTGPPGSAGAGAGAALCPSPCSSSSSSSSGKSKSNSSKSSKSRRSARRQQQQQQERPMINPVLMDREQDAANALLIQQEVQGQWSSLPASHTRLLEQLGCSVPTAVWLAAALRHSAPMEPVRDCLAHLTSLQQELTDTPWGPQHSLSDNAADSQLDQQQPQDQQGQQHPAGPRPQRGQYTQGDMLTAVLLYGAAHTCSSRPDAVTQSDIEVSLQLAAVGFAFSQCARDMHRLHRLQQQRQQQQWQQQQQVSMQSSCLADGAADELLPLSVSTLQQLQQHCGIAAASDATGARSTEAASRLQGDPCFIISVEVFLLNLACSCLNAHSQVHKGLPGSVSRLVASSALTDQACAVAKVFDADVRRQSSLITATLLPTEVDVMQVLLSHASASMSPPEPLPTIAAASGPGSQLQVQLFSMWSSALKWFRRALSCGHRPQTCMLTLTFSAETAVDFLGSPWLPSAAATTARSAGLVPSLQCGGSTTGSSSGGNISSAATGSSQAAGISNSSTSAPPGLMWLVLLGRYCLLLSALLQQGLAEAGNSPERQRLVARQCLDRARPSCSPMPLQMVALTVTAALSPQSSMAQQLSSCGYGAASEAAADSAGAVLAAVELFVQAPDSNSTALPELASAVTALGRALTSLAVPYCCNNPYCGNVSGRSDVALVSGKSCICGKCKVARYCGKACQQEHWRLHKPVCKALAAAQAAAQLSDTIGHS